MPKETTERSINRVEPSRGRCGHCECISKKAFSSFVATSKRSGERWTWPNLQYGAREGDFACWSMNSRWCTNQGNVIERPMRCLGSEGEKTRRLQPRQWNYPSERYQKWWPQKWCFSTRGSRAGVHVLPNGDDDDTKREFVVLEHPERGWHRAVSGFKLVRATL